MYPPRDGDLPIDKIAERAIPLLRAGHAVYLKWSCPACGNRVTATEPLRLVDNRVAVKMEYEHDYHGCNHVVDTETYIFGMTVLIRMTA